MSTVSFKFLDINWEVSLEGKGGDIWVSEVLEALHTGDCGETVKLSQSLSDIIADNWHDALNEEALNAFMEQAINNAFNSK